VFRVFVGDRHVSMERTSSRNRELDYTRTKLDTNDLARCLYGLFCHKRTYPAISLLDSELQKSEYCSDKTKYFIYLVGHRQRRFIDSKFCLHGQHDFLRPFKDTILAIDTLDPPL
jgi:hypothetical protein